MMRMNELIRLVCEEINSQRSNAGGYWKGKGRENSRIGFGKRFFPIRKTAGLFLEITKYSAPAAI